MMRNRLVHNLLIAAAFIAVAVGLFAVCASDDADASDFNQNGIYYNIIDSTSVEVCAPDSGSYTTDVIISDTVTDNGITYNVVQIGTMAFYQTHNITVGLPASINCIDSKSFSEVSALTINFKGDIPSSGIKSGSFTYASDLTIGLNFDPTGSDLYDMLCKWQLDGTECINTVEFMFSGAHINVDDIFNQNQFYGRFIKIDTGVVTDDTTSLALYDVTRTNKLDSTHRQDNTFVYLDYGVNKWVAVGTTPYTVTLDRVGGSGGQSSVSNVYENLLMPNLSSVPTLTGYTFGGYYDDVYSKNTQYYDSSGDGNWFYDRSSASTIYAKWIANTYTVTLKANGGSADGKVTATYDAALPSFTALTRTGYTLNGYYTAASDGTLVIDSSGTLLKSVTGYSDSDGNWIKTSGDTFYAQWTPIAYTIAFDGNGSTGGTSVASISAVYDTSYTAPSNTWTRTGYTFTKWNTAADGSGTDYAVGATLKNLTDAANDTVTLYAQWNANTYTINLDKNGGYSCVNVTATYGAVLPSFTAITRTGYTLNGYYTADTGGTLVIDSSGTLLASVSGYSDANGHWIKTSGDTFYAQWTVKTYSVTLLYKTSTDTYSGTNGSAIATYGSNVLTDLVPATRTGYVPGVYSSVLDSTDVSDPEGNLLSSTDYTDENGNWTADYNVSLVTVWDVKTYTVHLDGNGVSSYRDVTATYDAPLPSFTAITRTGYTLNGYYTADTGGTLVIDSSGVLLNSVTGYSDANGHWTKDGNATLYAQWDANEYDIDLDKNGGSDDGSATATYGSNVLTDLISASRTGYDVEGYYVESGCTTKVVNADGSLISNVSGYTDSDGKWIKTDNVTLYTKWTAHIYNIVLNSNGGTSDGSAAATYCGSLSSIIHAEYTNHTVEGYYTDASCSTKIVNADGSLVPSVSGYTDDDGKWIKTSDDTFYANWIHYDTNNNEYYVYGGTLYVSKGSGSGVMQNFSYGSNLKTTLGISASFTTVSMGSTMTTVGNSAFQGLTDLTDITMTGVTSIRNYAFTNCSNLSITSLPYGITYIGTSAFNHCTSLTLTSLPDSITTISYGAFEYCYNLALTSLPSGITTISGSAFYRCNNLVLTSLPSGVTSIGVYAFHQCTRLASMTLPAGISSIGDEAFSECTSLTSLIIPNTASTIGTNAFALGVSYKTVTCHVYGCESGKLDSYKNSYTTFIYEGGYTVTYKLGTGTYGAVDTEYYGEEITVRAKVTRTGYIIGDWTSADVTISGNKFTMPAKNVTITASITPITYTIAFDSNGGTGGGSYSINATYDQSYQAPGCKYTRTGYEFSCWNTSSDGSGTDYAVGSTLRNLTSVSDATVTLYAKWVPITYTIAFDGNGKDGGTDVSSITATYDQIYSAPSNTWTKTGYEFSCWNTSSDGSGTDYAVGSTLLNLTSVSGATVTLYAKWSGKITITADDADKTYDGSPLTKSTYTYTQGILKTGDVLTATTSGSITDVGTEDNTIASYQIMRGSVDVTSSYTITTVKGTLEITKRNVTLTSSDASKTYDGTALTKNEVTVSGSGFVSGQGATYNVTGTQTAVGSSKNTFTYTLNSGTDASNYDITKVEGTLTVNPAGTIIITADSASKMYDGTPLTKSTFTYTENILTPGDVLSAVITGTITDFGTASNVVSSYTVMRGSTDVTSLYTFGTSVNGTLEITKRYVTVGNITASGKVYDGKTTATLDCSAATFSGKLDADTLTVTATGTFADKNAGTGKTVNITNYVLAGADKDNYQVKSDSQSTTTADITKASLTITGATVTSKQYDGTTTGTVTAVTFSGLQNSESLVLDTDFTATGEFASENAGTTSADVTVTLGTTDKAKNYSLSSATKTVSSSITKASVTLDLPDAEKEYDKQWVLANPKVIDTGVNGENLSVQYRAYSPAVGTYTYAASEADGKYTITWYDGTGDTDNYSITIGTAGDYVINKKELTLPSASATSRAYNGSADVKANVSLGSLVGIVSGDELSVFVKSDWTAVMADKNVGENKAVTITAQLDGTAAGSYKLTVPTDVTITITKAPLTITGATVTSREYDGTKTGTVTEVTFSGLQNGETLALGTDYTAAGTFASEDAGTTSVSVAVTLSDTTKANNYSISNSPYAASSSITKRSLTNYGNGTVAVTKVYDGTTDAGTLTGAISFDGQVGTEAISISAAPGTYATKAAETGKTVTLTLALAGDASVTKNYQLSSTTYTFTSAEITKRDVTLTSATDSKTYDGSALTNDTVTVTGDGFATGEGATYNVTGSQTVVGSSNNTFTYTLNSGTDASNYNITKTEGTLTVDPAGTIIITADSASKMYDGTPLTKSTFTYTENILSQGDVLSAVITGTITDAGTASNVVTSYNVMRGSTDVTSLYTFGTSVNGTLEITKRNVTLTSSDASKTYDGTALTNDTVTVTGDGFADSEGATYNVTGTQTDAGSSTNAFTYTLNTGTKAGNYNISTANGTLTVSKRDVTLASASDIKTYDGTALTNSTVAVTGDGFATGEGASYNVTGSQTAVGSSSNTFTYTLNLGTDASNYNITKTEGTLTVKPVGKITITAGSTSKMYDGSSLTYDSFTYTENILTPGDVLTAVITGTITDVGTTSNVVTSYQVMRGTVDVTSSYEFEDSVNGTLEITKRNVTLTSSDASKTYDGTALTNDTVTVTGDGFATDEGATYNITGTQTDAGSSNNVFTYTLNSGTKAVNYNISAVNGTLTVSKRNVTLTSSDASKTYDGSALTNDTVTVTGYGFIAGQGASYSVTGSQTVVGSSKNTFTYTLDSGTDASNYNITKTEGTLTVNPVGKITITADSASKMYDGNALTKSTFTYTSGILMSGDDLTAVITGTITDFGTASNVVSSYTVMRGTVDVTSSYEFEDSVDGTLEITKRDVTLTSSDASKTYDGTALTKNEVTVSGSGFVSGQGATYNVTGTQTAVGSSKNTFTYSLNLGTDASNYNITKAEGTLTVDPAGKITITAASISKMYDGSPLTCDSYTYTSGILMSGDILTAVISGTITDFGTASNVVSSYKVMRGTVEVTSSYEFEDSVAGTLEITKRDVTLTSATDSKTYNGSALTNDSVTVSGSGFVGTEGATYNVTGTQTAVGSSKNTFTYTLNSGTDASNYSITKVEGDLVIDPATITGTISQSGTLTYNGSAQTAEVSNNLVAVNSQPITVTYCATQGGTYSSFVPAFTSVGAHTVFYKATAPNHNEKTGSFTVTIGQKDITGATITLDDSPVYNGSEQTQTIQSVVKDSLTLTSSDYDVTGNKSTHVGNVTLTVTGKGNYTGSASIVWSIQQATQDISYAVSSLNKSVGETFTNPLTTTLVFGTVSYSSSATAVATINSSTGSVTTVSNGTVTMTAYVPGNTDYTEATASYNIGVGTIIPTADDFVYTAPSDLVYSGTAKSASVTVKTGITGMGNITVKYYSDAARSTLVDASDVKDAAAYYVAIDVTAGASYAAANKIYGSDWNFTITPASITGSISQDGTLTYSGADQTPAINNGLTSVGSQSINITYCKTVDGTYSSVVPSFKDADSYTVYYKATASNHNEKSGSFAVDIGTKALTITANAKTTSYGDAAANNGVSYSGFVTGEDETVLGGSLSYAYTYDTTVPAKRIVGTYDITPSGLTSTNYEITFVKGTLTVEQKVASFSWTEPDDLVYDGTAKVPSVEVSNKAYSDDAFTIVSAVTAGKDNVNVGSFTFAVSDLGNTNYSLPTSTVSPEYTIEGAEITGTISQSGSLTYDGSAQTAEISNDLVSVNSQPITVTYCATQSGTYTSSVPAFTSAGTHTVFYKATAPNHDEKEESFTVVIGQKDITGATITLNDSPVYNGSEQTQTVQSVVKDSLTLTSSDYDVSGNKSTHVGNVTLTVTAKGNYSGSASIVWSIQQATQDISYAVSSLNKSVGETFTNPLTQTLVFGTVTYSSNDTDVATVNSSTGSVTTVSNGTATITAYISGNTDYTEATASYNIGVGTNVPTADDFIYAAPSDLVYSGTAKSASVTVKTGITGMGNITVKYYSDAARSTLVDASDVKNAVTYYVAIDVTAGASYVAANKIYGSDWNFTITPATITGSISQNGTLTYDASFQCPDINNELISVDSQDITVRYCETIDGTYSDFAPDFMDAGTYTVYYKATAPNHSEKSGSFNAVIVARALTITANPMYITYGSAAANNGVTYDGFPLGDDESSLSGTLSYAYTYDKAVASKRTVGTYDIIPSGLTSTNYNITFVKGTLFVGQRVASLSWTAPDDLVYDGSAKVPSVEVSNKAYSDDEITVVSGVTAGKDNVNVGSFTFTVSCLSNFNYSLPASLVSPEYTITGAEITGSISQSGTLTYNGSEQTAAVSNDLVAVNSQPITVTYCATQSGIYSSSVPAFTSAGDHTVYYKATAPNHSEKTGSFNVAIDAKALTITANAKTITYGDAAANNGVTYNGFVSGEDESVLTGTLSYAYTYDVTVASKRTVGTYDITPSGLTSDNYEITFTKGVLTVEQKVASLSWTAPDDLVYDGSAKVPSVEVSNKAYSDDTFTIVKAVTAGKDNVNVGSFTFTVSDLGNTNYSLPASTVSPEYAITNATITGTISQKDPLTYNAQSQVATVNNDLVSVNDQTITVTYCDQQEGTYSGTVPGFVTAGDHTVYYKATAPNHSEKTGSFTVTIGQKDITGATITLDDSPVYNGSEQTQTIQSVVKDSMTLTSSDYDVTGNKSTHVGNVTLTVTAKGNYSGSASIVWSIQQATQDISYAVSSMNKSVGETFTNPLTTTLVFGTVSYSSDDTAVATVNSSTGEVTTIGNGTVTITAYIPGNTDYTEATATYMVGVGTFVPTADDFIYIGPTDLTYSGTAKSASVTVKTGITGMGDITVKYYSDAACSTIVDAFDVKNTATYYVAIDVTAGATYAAASKIHDTDWNFTIIKVSLTVTAKDKAITYGDAAANDGVTYSGFVTGEDESVLSGTLTYTYSYDTSVASKRVAGTYDITPAGLTSANYEITFNDGILTVGQKEAVLSWTAPIDLVYDGTAKVPSVEVSGKVYAEDEFAIVKDVTAGMDDVNVGTFTYTVSSLGNSNYSMPESCASPSYEITKRTLNVTADPLSKTYADADPVFTYTFSGTVYGETPAFAGKLSRDSGEDAGSYLMKQGTLDVADNGSFKASNYAISFTDGVYFIIDLRTISTSDFTVDTSDETYSGTAKTKMITSALVINKDYTVGYTDNVKAGIAKIRITGIDNCAGTLDYQFKINKLGIDAPKELYYVETGSVINFEISDSAYYTETSGRPHSGTEPGTYSFMLTANESCFWNDASFTGVYNVYITLKSFVVKDENGNVVGEVTGDKGIRKDIAVSIVGTDDISSVSKALESVSGTPKYKYTVKFQIGGTDVVPEGNITVKLALPDNVKGQSYGLYSVINDKATKLSVSIEGDLVVTSYNGASEYAFVVKDKAAGFDWNTVLLVVAVIMALNVIFILYYALVLRRKHRKEKNKHGATPPF